MKGSPHLAIPLMNIIMENADKIRNAVKKLKSKQPNSDNVVKREKEG
jgi:hypothetical protein